MRWTMPPDRVPEAWFNVVPRLAQPIEPALHPGTRQPAAHRTWPPLPMALILQECRPTPGSTSRPVLDILRLWRPTPLIRARRLEQALDTRPDLLQDESVSRRLAQAQYRRPRPTTTARRDQAHRHGDGCRPVGSALAFSCALFASVQGLHVRPLTSRSPTAPDDGDLGGEWCLAGGSARQPRLARMAISDAVRDAGSREDTHYSLGSVLNHVLLHQTVIGLEPGAAPAAARRSPTCHRLLRRRFQPGASPCPLSRRGVELLRGATAAPPSPPQVRVRLR